MGPCGGRPLRNGQQRGAFELSTPHPWRWIEIIRASEGQVNGAVSSRNPEDRSCVGWVAQTGEVLHAGRIWSYQP